MNERGMIVTGAVCIISLLLVMIMAVNFRVNELEEDIKFLRGCIVELDMALEDVEYGEWLDNPECDPVPGDEDPFVTIN